MALFGRHEVSATVTAAAWSRTVVLVSQRWVSKRSVSPPRDGVRNVRKQTTAIVLENLPPGAGIPGPTVAGQPTQVRPQNYYTYEAVEWGAGRTLAASGTDPADVRWPEEALTAGERVKSRSESYTLALDADGRQYEATVPEQQWRALPVGSAVRVTLGLRGNVKSVTAGHA
jgi:hypothetical protein